MKKKKEIIGKQLLQDKKNKNDENEFFLLKIRNDIFAHICFKDSVLVH